MNTIILIQVQCQCELTIFLDDSDHICNTSPCQWQHWSVKVTMGWFKACQAQPEAALTLRSEKDSVVANATPGPALPLVEMVLCRRLGRTAARVFAGLGSRGRRTHWQHVVLMPAGPSGLLLFQTAKIKGPNAGDSSISIISIQLTILTGLADSQTPS